MALENYTLTTIHFLNRFETPNGKAQTLTGNIYLYSREKQRHFMQFSHLSQEQFKQIKYSIMKSESGSIHRETHLAAFSVKAVEYEA